ncbi:MAG: ribosome silencing factor [Acidobacteria bacterium]|nr:ribosome silencing factor [Acidobacteriota bacterium]
MKDALRLALMAFEEKKALDIVALDISKVASFASFFLICSGDSSRQIQAIADEVEIRLKKEGICPNHIEGYRHAEWVLLDYLDFVVHIFSKKARAFYDLERLWRDGRRMDVQRLLDGKTAVRRRAAGPRS